MRIIGGILGLLGGAAMSAVILGEHGIRIYPLHNMAFVFGGLIVGVIVGSIIKSKMGGSSSFDDGLTDEQRSRMSNSDYYAYTQRRNK
jgi:hypothetical protein